MGALSASKSPSGERAGPSGLMKSFTTKDWRPNVEMFFSAAIYHDMQQDVRNPQGGRGVHQPRAGFQKKVEMFSEDT